MSEDLQQIAEMREAFYAQIVVPFMVLPDQAYVQDLQSQNYLQALTDLAASEDFAADIQTGFGLMLAFLSAHKDKSTAELAEILGVDRTRLYRGVTPGFGVEPPLESVWSGEVDKTTVILQQLGQLYSQYGLGRDDSTHERLDYIGILLSFQHYLVRQEAEAWASNDDAQARSLLMAQAEFLHTHCLQWMFAFIEAALMKANTDFYRGHLTLLKGFLESEEETINELLEITAG